MLRCDDVYFFDFLHESGGGIVSGFLHGYIQTLVYSAAFCFVALAVTPDGIGKKAVGIVCAAAMIIAVISPIASIDMSDYSKSLSEYKLAAQKYAESGKQDSEILNRMYIQDKCRAYILDKAKKVGADVTEANVTAEWSNDGFWYPVKCEIKSDCTDDARAKLAGYIEAELGISKDNQKWCKTNE